LWSIFALQDSALTGLRQTLCIPLENIAFAIAKIVLLIVLAKSFQSVGLFASWNLPVMALILPVNWLIFKVSVPKHVHATSEQAQAGPLTLGLLARFVGGNYLGTLSFMASTTLMPIMVTNIAGATANAYFYPPWTIVTALQLVALNFSTSLTVEAAFDQTKLNSYSRQILVQTVRLVIPLVIFVLLSAPLILQVFGSSYATEGSAVLRWLALGTLPNILVALSISLARVQNRPSIVMLIQGTLSFLILSLSYVLLPILGITGVGIAWFAGQTIVAVFLLFTQLLPTIQLKTVQWNMLHRNDSSNDSIVSEGTDIKEFP
jgi:O-antigen/teichoic acid export membrane protein